jgi:hypothetical protein
MTLLGGCLFVALGGWLSSGTLAPYAITLPRPLIIKPCNYLVNTDEPHFECTFLMLQGKPAEQWKYSVVLRRTLFPLLAFPLMSLWGFLVGGVVTSLLLQVAAFAGFVIWVDRRIGRAAGFAAIALLATYPGIYYWAGLPYCYASIVPASLGAMVIVYELQFARSYARVAALSLLLGILFLAYDLLPYFAPAAFLVLALRRKFLHALMAAVLMIVPSVINKALLVHAGADFGNENSRLYSVIVNAYFHPPAIKVWLWHISDTPWSLVRVFFLSNFIFLPALFLVAVVANWWSGAKAPMGPAVWWILLTGLGLFLFINLAPPYKGWQFRGSGLARIYQPLFTAMLVFILVVFQRICDDGLLGAAARAGACLMAVTALVNASIVLGPATKNPLAAWTYWKFYTHAPRPMMNKNLALFGRRPLGFCNTRITIQNPPPRILGAGRKPSRARLEREARLHPEKLTRAQRKRVRQWQRQRQRQRHAATAPSRSSKAAASSPTTKAATPTAAPAPATPKAPRATNPPASAPSAL